MERRAPLPSSAVVAKALASRLQPTSLGTFGNHIIRLVKPQEHEVLLQFLTKQVQANNWLPPGQSVETLQKVWGSFLNANFKKPGFSYYIAVSPQTAPITVSSIQGCLNLKRLKPPACVKAMVPRYQNPVFGVFDLFVDFSHQKKGLGRQLLFKAEAEVGRNATLILNCTQHTVEFYKKMEFSDLKEKWWNHLPEYAWYGLKVTPFTDLHRYQAWHLMEKRLQPSSRFNRTA